MDWSVYIVECATGIWYCGCTNDVDARVATHNRGKGAKYTRARLPVSLLASVGGLTKSEAHKLEARVKKVPRAQKLAVLNMR